MTHGLAQDEAFKILTLKATSLLLPATLLLLSGYFLLLTTSFE
jgi:hypothetical protein